MTIDERIEALTQSVELLAGFHRDAEQRMEKLAESMGQLTDTMTRLGNIVIAHENRIENLESGRA
jgi:prefoldin subunit 5